MAFSVEEKQKCAERELKMRIRVYPRMVEKPPASHSRAMTKEQSQREIAIMAEIAEDYRKLAEEERLI